MREETVPVKYNKARARKENKITNIDTSSLQEGEDLYVDPENPGGLTAKKPVDGMCVWDEETERWRKP